MITIEHVDTVTLQLSHGGSSILSEAILRCATCPLASSAHASGVRDRAEALADEYAAEVKAGRETVPRVIQAEVSADTPIADDGTPIVYDTNDIDAVTHALTGDEGEDDSVTVLRRFAAYVENVWPGKTAMQVLIELEERTAGVQTPEGEQR